MFSSLILTDAFPTKITQVDVIMDDVIREVHPKNENFAIIYWPSFHSISFQAHKIFICLQNTTDIYRYILYMLPLKVLIKPPLL